jgi:hypothetical protein
MRISINEGIRPIRSHVRVWGAHRCMDIAHAMPPTKQPAIFRSSRMVLGRAPQCDTSQRPFGSVIVHLNATVISVACKRSPTRQRVTVRCCQFAFLRERWQHGPQPTVKTLEFRSCASLAHINSF